MKKKSLLFIIIGTALLAWVLDLLVGNYVSARLATWSVTRNLGIFKQQKTVVLNNRETVRVNNTNDTVQTAENAKNKVATLVYFDNDSLINAGSLVNWTEDGYFVSVKKAFKAQNKVYAVITSRGNLFPVEKLYTDPISEIVIVKTSARDLKLLEPVKINDLRIGEQVASVHNAMAGGESRFSTGYIKRLPQDISGVVMESDLLSRKLDLQIFDAIAGSAVLNLSGKLVGIWDGNAVVMPADISLLLNNLLVNNLQIVRPSLGFSYQLLSETEAKALQTTVGARVMGLGLGKPAIVAGLKVGDVIVAWQGENITHLTNLDNIIRSVQIGQSVGLKVVRDGKELDIKILPTSVK